MNTDDVNEKSFTKITDTSFSERSRQLPIDEKLVTGLEPSQGTYALARPRKVWSKGDCCLASFSGDNKYYKAVIKKIHHQVSPYEAHVSYIGYESEEDEVVPVASLRLQICNNKSSGTNKDGTEMVIKRDLVNYSFLEKERDAYMRQKYESSEEEAVVHVARKPKKLRKLRFCTKSGSRDRSRNHASNQSLKVHHVPTNVLSGNHGSCEDTRDSNKEEQISWGFTDTDLEKPHFQIKPIGDKVPFCVTNEFAASVNNVPASMNQYLRDYQRDGVCFLYKHLQLDQGCILGDDMGLGKTVQVIALIAAHFGKTGGKEDAMPSYLKKYQKKEEKIQRKEPFLVISPSSVLFNWEDELSSWGYFKIGRFHGASKKDALEKAKRGKLEIVLTTYETFRIHSDIINEVKWYCVVMDEAHKVKEPDSLVTKAAKKISCARRIGLTGTPMQNNMEELWCLLDWANPGCLGSLETFRNEFVFPIKLGQRFDATKRELATARKKQQEFGLLKDKWILRRTKALLVDRLPRKDERAVFAPLTELQVALYKAILAFPSSESVIQGSDPCDCASGRARNTCCHKLKKEDAAYRRQEIFHVITLLRKVANHAALLLPYHKASDKQKELALSICKKLFGAFPLLEDVYRNGSFARMSDVRFSGKLKILDRLLAAARDEKDKVLLFSTSVQLLNTLEAYIISKGYVYGRLDGDTKPDARIGIVREFNNNSDVFICLVSTKAGGLGLNFTGANVVIIFDPAWNPSCDNQAEDRAYRIGQRRNVRVYRLIAEGSIEENIYLRQIYKQQLSNIAVHSRNERRLFMGVAGMRSKQGEIFGLKNLLMLRTEGSNLTKDLLERTENIESGVRVVNFKVVTDAEAAAGSKHSDFEEDFKQDGSKTSQSSDEFASFIDDFITNSRDLYTEEDREEKVESDGCEGIGDKSSSIVDSENLSTDSEPPLESRKSRRNRSKRLSSRRDFRAIRKARRFQIEEGSDKEFECNLNVKKTSVRNQSYLDKVSKDWKDPESLLLMDDILDKCGVAYTSTTKKIMSNSMAEEKMTSEAIRDVFWHGMYSQEPAYFIDPSTSEESDDIPCLTKENALQNNERSTNATKTKQPGLLSKRVFEKIGSDMFLIGATPSLIRKQQFCEIARHYGFESSLDFAKSLILSTENEVKKKLFEFYKAKEPNIIETRSFKSIYSERSSMIEANTSNITSGDAKKSRYRQKRDRRKRQISKEEWLFEPDLDLCSGTLSEKLAGKKDLFSRVEKKSKDIKLIPGIKQSLTYSSHARGKFSRGYKAPFGDSNNSAKPQCFEDVVEETEIELGEEEDYEKPLSNEQVEWEKDSSNDRGLLSEVADLEHSDGILDEMMFNPVCNSSFVSSKTNNWSDENFDINDHTSNSRSSFSILDELMDGSVAVELTARKDKEMTINFSDKPLDAIKSQDEDLQHSASVLDELMG